MDVAGNNNTRLLKLLLVLIGGLTSFKCEVTQDCLPVLPLPQIQECYRPLDTTADCVYNHYTCASQPNAIKWRMLSAATGRVDIAFHLPLTSSCHQTQYDVELKLTDDPAISNEETCASAALTDFRLTHTKQRKYIVEDECAKSDSCPLGCDQDGVASFQFVFTGCYRIMVRPRYETHSRQQIESCPKYLTTNYSKALLTEEIPTFETSYHDKKRYSPVTITYAPLTCNHLDLAIKLIADVNHLALGEACYKTGRVHSDCLLGTNRSSSCDNITNRPTEGITAVPYCSIVSNRVNCVFGNMSPGNYCVRMEVQDDRCDPDTLWTKHGNGSSGPPCIWQNLYEAFPGFNNSDLEYEMPAADRTKSYITIGGILFGATLIAAIAVCLSLKMFANRRSTKAADLDLLDCGTRVEPCRILLLYARDCPPFMQLMTTFRLLLEDAASTEVYDCFDGSRWPELSRNPVEWMRGLLGQRGTKIIVVATKCSSLRQQALLANTRVRYQEPSSNDDLFLYALQTLTDTMGQDVYKRIFVVRFEGVSDDGDLFTHLNSYTRFVLPLHLDKLVSSLNDSIVSDGNVRLKEPEVESICQDLAHLTSYINQNDNYLQKMLTIIQRSS